MFEGTIEMWNNHALGLASLLCRDLYKRKPGRSRDYSPYVKFDSRINEMSKSVTRNSNQMFQKVVIILVVKGPVRSLESMTKCGGFTLSEVHDL